MTADIKPFVASLKQSYVTKGNAYQQSLYGTSLTETYGKVKRSTATHGLGSRIRSAAQVEQNSQGTKEQTGAHVSYTKFRPVSSQPSTTLLASLYKQQSFAESRNSQAAAKLPNILQSRAIGRSSKSQRELKPFVTPVYSATAPTLNSHFSNSTFSQTPPKFLTRPPVPQQQHPDEKIEIRRASATFKAVQESISANGHGIFHEAPPNTTTHLTAKAQGAENPKRSSNRPSVNYVPFYEVRGRGDGASVVDIPSIDIEGKKIEKKDSNIIQQEKSPHSTSNVTKSFPFCSAKAGDEGNMSKKSDEQSSAKVTGSNEKLQTPAPLASSFLRPSTIKSDLEQSVSSTKVEKKVRFSGTITTNKISEEPSYTEALINSLHKSFKHHNYLRTAHRTIKSTLGATEFRDLALRGESTSVGTSSAITDAEDDPTFVTPIMKIVVTKRETPAGAERRDTNLSPSRDVQQTNPTSHEVAVAASRLINTQTNSAGDKEAQPRLEPRPLTTAEVIRKGTQATQRASTAGYTRNKEAIARVVRLVPKRQTVIMPNFSKQQAWSARNFPQHGKSSKFVTNASNSPEFSASVRGSPPPKEIKYKKVTTTSTKENFRSRLTNVGKYSSKTDNKHMKQSTEERKKTIENELAATPLIALPTTENVSQVAMLSPRLFTDFQPIPSMPDHINFCDPRKTELILHWLEDVNRKRNIESRLRRVGLSK